MSIAWNHKSLLGLKTEREKFEPHPVIAELRLRLYPNGRKSWQWARMLAGKPLRKSLGRFPMVSMVEAEALARELNDQLDLGVDPTATAEVTVEAGPERVTVTVAWKRYIADCERRKCRSVHSRNLTGLKDIIPVVGEKLLSDVTGDEIREIR